MAAILVGRMRKMPFVRNSTDDRLNATILLNDSVWKSTAVENWDGGKDGLGVTNATKTGFYLKNTSMKM